MNESENKTAKDLLDESIDSIKAKKIESKYEEDSEELDLSDEKINDEANELYFSDGCDDEDDTFGDDNEEIVGADNEDISGDKDDLDSTDEDDVKNVNNVNIDENTYIANPTKRIHKKLTALSVILSFIPGLGQAYAGKIKRGAIVFGVFILVLFLNGMISNSSLPSHYPLIALVLYFLYPSYWLWNMFDAWKISDNVNKVNGFSKSNISDDINEYDILGKIFLIILKIISNLIIVTWTILKISWKILWVLGVIVCLPIILPLKIIRWISGKISQCPSCGRDGALIRIDTEVTGRSNSYTKYNKDWKEYRTYERQELLITYECKYCGHIVQKRSTKEVRLK